MEEISTKIASWPCLNNGIHYKWLVDYAAFSAFGTFELSAEEWEKRDLIVNFKGNSELTTHRPGDRLHKEVVRRNSVFSYLRMYSCIAAPAYRAPLQAIQ